MKRKTRKILSAILSMSLMTSLFSGAVFADPVEEPYELSYRFVNPDESSSFEVDQDGNYIAKDHAYIYAELQLTNKSDTDTVLQAFDFYVEHDQCLYPYSYTPNNNDSTRVTDTTNGSTATSEHIQLIGRKDSNNHYIDPGIELDAGDTVTLGTLQFDLNGQYEYGDQLLLYYSNTPSKRANIAVELDDNSHYPAIAQNPNCVIVDITYQVAYHNFSGVGVHWDEIGHNETTTIRTFENIGLETPDNMHFTNWVERDYNGNETSNTYSENQEIYVTRAYDLYPHFEYNQYTVTFRNANGDVSYSENVTYNEFINSVPSAENMLNTISGTPEDYIFVGWTAGTSESPLVRATDFPGYVMNDTVMRSPSDRVSGPVEFGPVFQLKSDYSVNFTSGSAYPNAANMPANRTGLPRYSKVAEPAETPTIPGYTFAGWYSDAACEEPWIFDSNTLMNQTTTIYAKFTANTYDITYVTNGGGFANNYTAPSEYEYGTGSGLPSDSDISKTGYLFAGWYDNSSLTGDPVTTIGTNETGAKTLYAKWAPISYTFEFNANGGAGTMNDQSFNYDEDQALTKNEFTREGYSFKGWSLTANPSNDANIDFADMQTVSNYANTNGTTIKLYAVWSDDDYTITYNLDGGIVNGTNPTTYTTETSNITLINPTRTGYSFSGWTGTGLNSATMNVTITSGSTGNRTYTATWSPINYTLEYDVNGGTAISDTTYNTTSADILPTPVKTGYVFEGWNVTSTEGDTNWNTSTVYSAGYYLTGMYGNITLTAMWTPVNYTITFNSNGGSPVSPMAYTIEATDALPTSGKTGYNFAGWKVTTASGSWTLDNNKGTSYVLNRDYGDVTLTAQWTAVNYTITYAGLNGATVTANPETYTIESNNITLNNPTKTGYTFTGWTGTGLDSATTAVTIATGSTGNRTYTATWQVNTYNVTFLNENDTPIAEVPYTVENPDITPPTVPEKPGYDGVWEQFEISTSNPDNIEVKPSYTATEYTITFNTDGGTTISSMTYTIESKYTLPAATGKNNYIFNNWKVTTAGGNWQANAAIEENTSVEGKYGNVTLTAQWTIGLSYTVEEYKYAYTGYRMLRIDASGLTNENIYMYNGVAMFYTEDASYMMNDNPVFFTLIPATSNELTSDQIAMITTAAGTRSDFVYNGDVNGDSVVNIADANAVYQMLAQNTAGGYYTAEQLSVRDRLAADMSKSTTSAEHRGSIADLEEIMTLINGSSN